MVGERRDERVWMDGSKRHMPHAADCSSEWLSALSPPLSLLMGPSYLRSADIAGLQRACAEAVVVDADEQPPVVGLGVDAATATATGGNGRGRRQLEWRGCKNQAGDHHSRQHGVGHVQQWRVQEMGLHIAVHNSTVRQSSVRGRTAAQKTLSFALVLADILDHGRG